MNIESRTPTDLHTLERLANQARLAVQRDRYRAVAMALRKEEAPRIAQQLQRSRRWVQTWAYRYRDGGIAALIDKPRPGQPVRLSPDQQQRFKARIIAGPTEADGGVCTLHGEDIRRILEREFNACYAPSGVYKLLYRLGLSSLTPRPRHRKNEPQAMRQWLDDAPFLSRKSAKTPAGKSASSSRMKPGSASKAR